MSAEPWSMRFLREMTAWAAVIAFAIAVGGGFVTRDWRFVLACAIGAAFDVVSITLLLRSSSLATPEETLRASRLAALLIAPRLAVKAVLLASASLLPRFLDLWGMLAGVLVFDLTVMTVGSMRAASDAFRT